VANSAKLWITTRDIRAQPDGPFILWDNEVIGLVARRQLSEMITYSVFYRTKEGQQRWYKLGHHGTLTPMQARDRARKIRIAAYDGEADPAKERYDARNSPTMSELLDLYIEDMQSARHNGKKLSTQKSDLSRIKIHIRPKLGKFKVVAVTSAQVEAFMNSCASGSAKRIIQVLGAIFTFAIAKKMTTVNPCVGIKKPADVRRTRRLSEAEYAHLGKALGAAQSPVHDIFLALAISGWRAAEMRLLKRSEVDLSRRIASLSDTKTGPSVRPLSSVLIEMIKRQPVKDEYVFTKPNGKPFGNIYSYWRAIRLPKDVVQHTMRHSFASQAADLGSSDSIIGSMIGHSQSTITSRYLHPVNDTIIKAADATAAKTLQLMGLSLEVTR
jgi:integrase